MVMRFAGLVLVALLAGCKTPVPLTTTPSFVTYPALATHNPNDIARIMPTPVGQP